MSDKASKVREWAKSTLTVNEMKMFKDKFHQAIKVGTAMGQKYYDGDREWPEEKIQLFMPYVKSFRPKVSESDLFYPVSKS